ncbi:MAG: ABC transporter permease [Actinobacteria bacterium]|nr:ABC transporter permease [Actinomycetota bacterium]
MPAEANGEAGVVTPAPEPATEGPKGKAAKRSGRATVEAFLAKYGVVLAFLLTVAVFCIARPHTFATGNNAKSILTVAAPSLVMACGLTVVLVMQDFDLSFGSMIGLADGAAITLMATHGWNWEIALIIALLLGIAAGAVNGYLISYLGGPSFIITLAMGTVLTGVEFAITSQNTIFSGVPAGYAKIGQGTFLGFSNMIWIAAVIAALLWVMLDRTELGRYMYAIGGNPEAARLAGIRTKFLRLLGFVAVGLAAAVVGILISSQSAAYSPSPGTSYLLPAFAAAFLGSAVFRPGEFNIPGTILGVLFLGVIQTGLTMLNLETYVINLVQGAILISAVLVSRLGQRVA